MQLTKKGTATGLPSFFARRESLHLRSMEVITVQQCLAHMETGATFSCKCITFDRKRRTGGDVLDILAAVLLRNDTPLTPSDRPPTPLEAHIATIANAPKKPNHSEFYTRNIRLCSAGHPTETIKKIHPPLLIEFNGITVVP